MGREYAPTNDFLYVFQGVNTDKTYLTKLQEWADGGDSQACLELGILYYDGEEIPQDSKSAYKYFSKAEEAGNALAAYYKGLCLYYGCGVLPSDDGAHALFEKAAGGGVKEAQQALNVLPFPEHELIVRAKGGDGEACCILGCGYDNNDYDYDDFLMDAKRLQKNWYEVGAAFGDPQCLFMLGVIYAEGWHVWYGDVKDEGKSKSCYEEAYKSAKSALERDGGNAYAKYWLGRCMVCGAGCEQNAEEGLALQKQAEAEGYAPSKYISRRFSFFLDGYNLLEQGDACYSEARRAEWQAKSGKQVEKNAQELYNTSIDCYRRAIESGYVYARFGLAQYYFNGEVVEKDYAKARKILLPLAKCSRGCKRHVWMGAAAARMLGDIYLKGGFGVERDEVKAFNWYKSGADRGNVQACFRTGNAYFYGSGTEKQYNLAAQYFEDAVFDYDEQMFYGSEKGYDYRANVGLGDCYRLGLGVKQDEDEAFRLYDDVSKYTSDCPAADERVARCYYFGIGVEKDEEKAKSFWELAAGNGDEDAKAALQKYFNVD